MFFVSLPDMSGKPRYGPAAVIEATAEEVSSTGLYLRVIGPEDYVAKWPAIMARRNEDFARCSGPARLLDANEYAELTKGND